MFWFCEFVEQLSVEAISDKRLALQAVLPQQRPPLAGVQLVTSSLLRLLFDHVAPGGPQGRSQSRTDPGET